MELLTSLHSTNDAYRLEYCFSDRLLGVALARLAIFIDGGYIDALAEKEFFLWVDYDKFAKEVTKIISRNNAEPLDLLRTYYYNCLPYQSSPATPAEAEQFAKKRSFFEALSRLNKFQVREGRLALRGRDN